MTAHCNDLSSLQESQDMTALPLRQSKYSSCDMTQKENTTAADNGSSFVKASEKLHADLAAVASFTFCYKEDSQTHKVAYKLMFLCHSSLGKRLLNFTRSHPLVWSHFDTRTSSMIRFNLQSYTKQKHNRKKRKNYYRKNIQMLAQLSLL